MCRKNVICLQSPPALIHIYRLIYPTPISIPLNCMLLPWFCTIENIVPTSKVTNESWKTQFIVIVMQYIETIVSGPTKIYDTHVEKFRTIGETIVQIFHM